jgi:hypothetical protein
MTWNLGMHPQAVCDLPHMAICNATFLWLVNLQTCVHAKSGQCVHNVACMHAHVPRCSTAAWYWFRLHSCMHVRLFSGCGAMHALVQMCQDTVLHMSPLDSGFLFRVVSLTHLHVHSRSPMALGRGLVENFTLPMLYCMASEELVFVHWQPRCVHMTMSSRRNCHMKVAWSACRLTAP